MKHQEATYYWDVGKVTNIETNGINYVIIPIVSTQIFIPADSMFVVLKKS